MMIGRAAPLAWQGYQTSRGLTRSLSAAADVDLDGAAAEGTPAQALAVPGAVKGTRPSLHSAQCQTGASLDGRQQSPLSPGHQAPSPVAVEAEPLQAGVALQIPKSNPALSLSDASLDQGQLFYLSAPSRVSF